MDILFSKMRQRIDSKCVNLRIVLRIFRATGLLVEIKSRAILKLYSLNNKGTLKSKVPYLRNEAEPLPMVPPFGLHF